MISELNERSREVFRQIVDSYMETGEPVGSRTLSRRLGANLSPATIRNVMADLEEAGLLYAPHTSAGRLPTEAGLRLFVDGFLEIGRLSENERDSIEVRCAAAGRSYPEILDEATQALAGLSQCAGLVFAPKVEEASVKHIEFVSLSPGRALVVMVLDTGMVENRVIELPPGVSTSSLTEATNYLNARLVGRSIAEARSLVQQEMEVQRAQIDELTRKVVEDGLATRAEDTDSGYLIVRGQSRLLDDIHAVEDLERIRSLFAALETKDTLIKLLDATNHGDGVQIFIGAESELFGLAGCSMIIAPYSNSREKVLGAIGVIGPTRMNYARIIPMVDYTSKVIGRLIG